VETVALARACWGWSRKLGNFPARPANVYRDRRWPRGRGLSRNRAGLRVQERTVGGSIIFHVCKQLLLKIPCILPLLTHRSWLMPLEHVADQHSSAALAALVRAATLPPAGTG